MKLPLPVLILDFREAWRSYFALEIERDLDCPLKLIS